MSPALAKPAAPITVLGIDPGLANLGWGVVTRTPGAEPRWVAHGVFCTGAGEKPKARVEALLWRVSELIEQHAPTLIAVEEWVEYPGLSVNYEGTQVLRVCGALVALAAFHRLPLLEYPAQALKGSVTADRYASKEAVQKAVQRALGLPSLPTPDHAADALAAALTGLRVGVPAAPPPPQRPARKPRPRRFTP